jgi:hypothetical protein
MNATPQGHKIAIKSNHGVAFGLHRPPRGQYFGTITQWRLVGELNPSQPVDSGSATPVASRGIFASYCKRCVYLALSTPPPVRALSLQLVSRVHHGPRTARRES